MSWNFFSFLRILFAIFIAIFPATLHAATVANLTDQPSSTQISIGANHKFTFTVTSEVSEGSTLSIMFPAGFNLSAIGEDDVDIADDGVDLTTASNCAGGEQASVSIAGQTISVSLCAGDGGAIANGSLVVIEVGANAASSGFGVNRITNPSAVASYFIALSETGGNSGSVVFTTTSSGSAAVTATVPELAESGGGGGGGGAPGGGVDAPVPVPDPIEPDPDPESSPDPDPEPTIPTDQVTDPDPVTPSDPDGPTDNGTSPPGGSNTGSDTAPANDGVGSGSSSPNGGESTDSNVSDDTPVLEGGDDGVVAPPVTDDPEGDGQTVVTPEPDRPTTVVRDESAARAITTVIRALQSLPERVDAVRQREDVQQAAYVAIPLTVAAAVSTTAVLATTFNLLSYLQFLFTSPFLFFARRKRKAFGVVYNSATKVAIDLAIVRLYDDATNQLVKSAVTDVLGKYFFIVKPGRYRLTVTKHGFVFPSTDLADVKDDGIYLDVYSGQPIDVTAHDATIAANVPLDVAQGQALHTPVGIRHRKTLRRLQTIISFSGSFLSMIVFFVMPSMLTGVLALLQICVFLLFRHLAHPKRPRGWGVVYSAISRQPVGNAVVRLFEPKYNKLVETTLTDSLGRYSFLVGPNEYFVSTTHEGFHEQIVRPIDYRDRHEPGPLAIDVPMEPK